MLYRNVNMRCYKSTQSAKTRAVPAATNGTKMPFQLVLSILNKLLYFRDVFTLQSPTLAFCLRRTDEYEHWHQINRWVRRNSSSKLQHSCINWTGILFSFSRPHAHPSRFLSSCHSFLATIYIQMYFALTLLSVYVYAAKPKNAAESFGVKILCNVCFSNKKLTFTFAKW